MHGTILIVIDNLDVVFIMYDLIEASNCTEKLRRFSCWAAVTALQCGVEVAPAHKLSTNDVCVRMHALCALRHNPK